ncbi:Crp/Fnr family transcriptional regulator [Neorhizobium galegae]|uniref:Crp/Fnr family transcriptional regulator n=1 Tax=Neorhizobium galegae TaxID=399 RepID=UPI000621C622|nr:Crp/Fnr family transcriptional regulator [Neorhizobium galegae]CDZ62000.1 Transcriptional regulator, Crp/Fnr family [Neorhizobium galegae bv. orientalis]KAB1122127.1 Crp/Fnr family transcriptional regulator [Neorhizobium galegae]MCQ1574161.1 Crp/Fnr family transcriptional regulator [Neorhizobium galegae]MCQ1810576.1 Crp/Fnr family transcriptional regulator [Neorhizobium galegae]MCQ1837541.1 Crp/Fnr family transcriptional regulator [Neorhizobium galegae]
MIHQILVPSHNRLLSAITPEDKRLLAPSLERIQLNLRQSLERAHQPIEFVYFLETGLGSVVASKEGGSTVEVGLFGRDGMTGTSLVQGDTESPFDCFVQMGGSALRVSADNLREVLSKSIPLTALLTHYARALGIQTTYTALANGQIKLEERLARWILMVHDRTDGDSFSVTHEFLAMMLGVRRPGVTVALQILESKRFIKSQRGEILVRDRHGLIDLSQGTYGPAETEYERLTGIPLGKSKQPIPDDDAPSRRPA